MRSLSSYLRRNHSSIVRVSDEASSGAAVEFMDVSRNTCPSSLFLEPHFEESNVRPDPEKRDFHTDQVSHNLAYAQPRACIAIIDTVVSYPNVGVYVHVTVI